MSQQDQQVPQTVADAISGDADNPNMNQEPADQPNFLSEE
jgi:hypothetical protein